MTQTVVVSAQIRIAVAQAMSKLSDAIGTQAGTIASGATPQQVLQSIQTAVGNISQQLAQNLP